MDLCCEIVRRLREDINRIFFDGKVYTSIETVYEQKVLKYDRIVNDFNSKLTCFEKIASHSSLAYSKRVDLMFKALEFFEFVKLTRMYLEHKLEEKCKNLQFMSCNGLPLGLYLTKLSDFITLVEKNYVVLFTHPGCVSAYYKLEKQIKTSLSSMLSSCDGLEGMIAYVDSAVPLLSRLIGLIDSYNLSPISDFYEFYHHKFYGKDIPEPVSDFDPQNARLSLYCILDMTDVENTAPAVSSHSPERFINAARNLAKIIFELEFVERRPISAVGITGVNNGCLDPNFLDTLHTLPINHLSDLPNIRRTRGRPRKPNYFSLPKNESSFKQTIRVSNDPLSVNDLE